MRDGTGSHTPQVRTVAIVDTPKRPVPTDPDSWHETIVGALCRGGIGRESASRVSVVDLTRRRGQKRNMCSLGLALERDVRLVDCQVCTRRVDAGVE